MNSIGEILAGLKGATDVNRHYDLVEEAATTGRAPMAASSRGNLWPDSLARLRTLPSKRSRIWSRRAHG
jgi:hypothetical protein